MAGCHVEVKQSCIPNAGNGLFAKRSFHEGELVCEYTGKVKSLMEAMRTKDKSYMIGGFGLNVHLDAADCPDSMGRYINDPRNEAFLNVRFVKLKSEQKALIIALRDIQVCKAKSKSQSSIGWRGALCLIWRSVLENTCRQ